MGTPLFHWVHYNFNLCKRVIDTLIAFTTISGRISAKCARNAEQDESLPPPRPSKQHLHWSRPSPRKSYSDNKAHASDTLGDAVHDFQIRLQAKLALDNRFAWVRMMSFVTASRFLAGSAFYRSGVVDFVVNAITQ
jgi:hypothetical protein